MKDNSLFLWIAVIFLHTLFLKKILNPSDSNFGFFCSEMQNVTHDHSETNS